MDWSSQISSLMTPTQVQADSEFFRKVTLLKKVVLNSVRRKSLIEQEEEKD